MLHECGIEDILIKIWNNLALDMSKVNIIFVTVCSENEHAKEVMRLKTSGYLTKEATSAQILEELQNLRYPVA